jgi:hypothetical protein
MDPRHLTVDCRFVGLCVYCGGVPDTSDHVPSKILLDDPLPPDMATVEACSGCNKGFSLDEEYFASFLECVVCGTTKPADVGRNKVSRTLAHSSSLVERIRSSMHWNDDGSLLWSPEEDRVRRIVIKLARGHAAYELSLPQIDEPIGISIRPFAFMSREDRATFENFGTGQVRLWPEIGSRAFHREVEAHTSSIQLDSWRTVQAGRYRYSVYQDVGVCVRLVLSEYLACTVVWE